RKLERKELTWLLVGLAACILVFVFFKLASEVLEGETNALDTRVLSALRDPSDPGRPIGPAWIEFAMLDLTSLGSPTVLGLVVVGVVGFLLLQGRYHTAIVVLVASVGGDLANVVLKNVFMRPRPT